MVCGLLAAAPVRGCFYHELAFDPDKAEQTDAEGLMSGRYDTKTPKEQKEFFKGELDRLKQELTAKRKDLDFLDAYAVALYRNAQEAEAREVWSEILKAEPDRFVTLCNLGTSYHHRQQLELAAPLIEKAAKLRPDFRNGAERWHARMIDFVQKLRKDSTYSKKHLFIDELSALWLNRRPEDKWGQLPIDVNSDGVAELLRQFPSFGDGWVVLGLVLESEGEEYRAVRAYERALKEGTGQRDRLEPYLRHFREYAKADDPGRKTARAAIWAAVCLGLLVVGVIGFKFGSAMWEDVKESRENKGGGRGPL